jgi:hypothetical protein
MPSFVMLTRVSVESLHEGKSIEPLERQAMDQIRKVCPTVQWHSSDSVPGPYGYIDVFSAPDIETAKRASTMIRSYRRWRSGVEPARA